MRFIPIMLLAVMPLAAQDVITTIHLTPEEVMTHRLALANVHQQVAIAQLCHTMVSIRHYNSPMSCDEDTLQKYQRDAYTTLQEFENRVIHKRITTSEARSRIIQYSFNDDAGYAFVESRK